MRAEEIRKIQLPDVNDFIERTKLILLRELTAQLAELNANFRIKTALDAGDGYPE